MRARGLVLWLAVAAVGCDQAGTEAPPVGNDVVTGPDSLASDASATAPDASADEDTAGPADTGAAAEDSAPSDTTVVADTSVTPDGTTSDGPRQTFAIPPITVLPGKERQVCRTLNIAGTTPFDVVRFESRMRGLSHHFNLYKVIDGTALDPVTPEESETHDCEPASEQLRGDAAYIFGSAAPERTMETPPGVAFHLEPGQRLILEYHAINYTLDPIEAEVQIDLVGAAPGAVIEHHADIMWMANWGFSLPPGRETSDTTQCSVPYDVEVFGLMSHFHELGTHFTIEAIQGGTSSEVYANDDWNHPKYQPFAPPLSLAKGDAIRWTCTWNNTRSTWTMPNKGSKDEMCMVFAAAYPKDGLSAEPVQCNVWF